MRLVPIKWGWVAVGAVFMVPLGQILLAQGAKPHAMKQVFADVMRGKQKPNSKGVLPLSPKLSYLSCDGNAYVTRQKSRTLVFFPSFLGKGANVQGTLICSKPLGSKQQSVEIIYPQLIGFYGPYGPRKNEVFINEKLADDTYFVFNDLS